MLPEPGTETPRTRELRATTRDSADGALPRQAEESEEPGASQLRRTAAFARGSALSSAVELRPGSIAAAASSQAKPGSGLALAWRLSSEFIAGVLAVPCSGGSSTALLRNLAVGPDGLASRLRGRGRQHDAGRRRDPERASASLPKGPHGRTTGGTGGEKQGGPSVASIDPIAPIRDRADRRLAPFGLVLVDFTNSVAVHGPRRRGRLGLHDLWLDQRSRPCPAAAVARRDSTNSSPRPSRGIDRAMRACGSSRSSSRCSCSC